MVYGGDSETWRWSDFLLVVFAGLLMATTTVLLLAPFSAATQLVGSLVAQYVSHLIVLASIARRRGSSLGRLGLDVRPTDGLYLLGGVALQIAISAATLPIAERLGLDESSQSLAESIPSINGIALQVGLVGVITILAPVTEELVFRGLVPRLLLRRMPAAPAYGVAALLFAVSHLIGVTPGEDFLLRGGLLVCQLFVVGAALGWQAYRRRRLGTAIFIHSGFNLVAVLVLLVAPGSFS